MGQLFGTDGIRGVANTYPITCEMATKTGQAVARFVQAQGYSTIVIGKDTRISGDMLEAAVAAGVASTGMTAMMAGIIPTPGVAFLCKDEKTAGAGIVLSASHNPYQDNGIKIFKQDGLKLSDQEERRIEQAIFAPEMMVSSHIGKIEVLDNALDRYARFLRSKVAELNQDHTKKIKLVVDCSNGAASAVSKKVFDLPCFDAQFIHDHPDGKNINAQCGSQHTQDLCRQVIKNKAEIGIAFDGDADRLIAVDETGTPLTGDCILAICAWFAKNLNKLDNNIVVSTIMSNVGLTQSLEQMGITHDDNRVG
jgi:phosphoglucosamine mutase